MCCEEDIIMEIDSETYDDDNLSKCIDCDNVDLHEEFLECYYCKEGLCYNCKSFLCIKCSLDFRTNCSVCLECDELRYNFEFKHCDVCTRFLCSSCPNSCKECADNDLDTCMSKMNIV